VWGGGAAGDGAPMQSLRTTKIKRCSGGGKKKQPTKAQLLQKRLEKKTAIMIPH
jgi:hypothetical protein